MLLKTWRKTMGLESSSSPNDESRPLTTEKHVVAGTISRDYNIDSDDYPVAPEIGSFSQFLAEGYKGQFFRSDHGSIIGWIASDAGRTIAADQLKVRISGSETQLYSVKSIFAFDVEIDEAFQTCLFFEAKTRDRTEFGVDNNTLTAELYMVKSSQEIDVLSGERLLASSVGRLNGEVFNTNPLMITDSNLSMFDWAIDHDERSGLRLDRFSFDDQDMLGHWKSRYDKKMSDCTNSETIRKSHKSAAYSRITLTDISPSRTPVKLICSLTPVRNLESEELEVVMRVRSDRPTWLICRLKRNGTIISTTETLINYQWGNYRQKLKGSNITPLFRTVNYQLEIELKHEGRGFIDFAACAVGLSPRLSQVFLPGKKGDEFPASADFINVENSNHKNFIRNGDFSAWSNGITFETFKPRQQTADGWRFECRENQVDQVELQLVNVNETSPREKPSQRSYGLRVQTREFSGPMRVVTVLDHGFLNATAASLTLGLSVTDGASPVQFLRRIYIVGRSMGKEEILHIIARKPRVHDHTKLVYLIDESTVIRLRRTIGVYSSLLLVVEYEMCSDVVISSAQLCQTNELSVPENQGASETLSHCKLCFEDPGILPQSIALNGLEAWAGDVVKVDHSHTEHNAFPSIYTSTSRNFVVPSWTRPSRHYPTVDVVVPIYNALDALRDCLTSLIRETTVPYTLICVDDASALETREFLAQFSEGFPHVKVVTNSDNIGYTRNVNRGIENSTADWICILNSDCIVTTNWLERLLDVAISSTKAGIVSPLSNAASYQSIPRIRNDDNEWSFNPLPATMQPNDMANLVWEHSLSAHPRAGVANGFCQLIRRDMLDSIGWLDEASFPRGFGEENDLCARAVKGGWDIRIADDTYVFHVKSQSFGHKERKRLSKEGSSALKEKHPDVDWKLITNELEHEHSLVVLRKRLIAAGI